MNDPLLPPPPSSSTAINTPTNSPSPSPRKSLSSSNHVQSGSPSSSIGADSKSSTPRVKRRNSKHIHRSSLSRITKSPVSGPSIDSSISESARTENILPNLSLHSNKSQHKNKYNDTPDGILPDPQNPYHRQSLPRPLSASKCPLLCAFYAEFDIVVGPMVCFQSPSKFMFFDINVGQNEINQSLEETFQHIKQDVKMPENTNDKRPDSSENTTEQKIDTEDYWNWVTDENGNISEPKDSETVLSSQSTLPASGNKTPKSRNTDGDDLHATALNRSPSFTSSKGASLHEDSTIDSETLQNSIFAACSEYIITGNELANQTITVSTHGMHILSRPMIISDTKRYERNSLLFSVGFVLRRNIDPRPWWPVLSNLSRTFQAMELESEFLSHERTRPMIQTVLEDVLVSLNSTKIECHLLLNEANLLNLQLFQPPPPPVPPVPDYAVPILLRPEWQLQLYDWDLTINWILPHIDGCKYVKQIAQSSEVDMELVRSCLRVLKHHGVLSYVDIFRYSNVYECTPLGKRLFSPILAGEDSKEGNKLLEECFWYAVKRKFARQAPSKIYREMLASTSSGTGNSPGSFSSSPLMNSMLNRRHSQPTVEDYEPRSFPTRSPSFSIAEEPTPDDDTQSPSSPKLMNPCSRSPNTIAYINSFLRDAEMMKKALAILYCSCTRDCPFGDVLMSKVTSPATSPETHVDEKHDVSLHSLDSSVMAPLYESVDDDVAEASSQKNSAEQNVSDIDWSKVFNFDHRRLITFGIAHNLIQRVHQYPLAYKSQNENSPSTDGTNLHRKSSLCHEYDTGSVSQIEFSAQLFDEQHQNMNDAASAVTPTLSHSSLQVNDVEEFSRSEPFKATKITFTDQVAMSMDGTRCDDELSCMFGTPVEDLIDMLRKTGSWNIISVFSPAT